MSDTVLNIGYGGGGGTSLANMTDNELATLRTRLGVTANASLVASLAAGENTLAGASFSPAITAQPALVSVLLAGEPQDVKWSSVLNGSNYDIIIYTTDALENVTIIAR